MIEIKTENPDVPERLSKLARALAHPRPAMADLGGHWQARVKKSMPDLPPLAAASPGQPPGVHSSGYVRTIIYDAPSAGQELRLGSSSIRARILEEGGVIHARRRRNLAIPIAAESYGKRPVDFTGLSIGAVFRRGGMRKALLGRGKGPTFLPLFVLQPHVRIRPHPHMAVPAEDWEYFGRALERQADREVGVG